MNLGNQISLYRKRLNLTQEQLASQLNISNQAVSKWELEQCYPDITLLPKLADVFGISLDELFGNEKHRAERNVEGLPWEDDDELHAVLYVGHKLVGHDKLNEHEDVTKIQFEYKGQAKNINSEFSVVCENVEGNITAGDNVTCGDVKGNVEAWDSLVCKDVSGNVNAGENVQCNDIGGSVSAGDSIDCNNISGSASAGGDIICNTVKGSKSVGGSVNDLFGIRL